MRILHIITSLSGGGRERRLSQLIIGLNRKGFSQYLFLLKNKIDYKVPLNNDQIFVADESTPYAIFQRLKNTIDNIRPDVVQVWTEIPIILVAVSFFKYRYKYALVTSFVADGNPIRGLKEVLSAKFAFKLSDIIISNSKAGLLAKKTPMNKSKVIYNGFDFSRFVNVKDEDIRKFKESIHSEDKILISMIARMDNAKDWESYFKTADLIGQTRNDIVFLAVGAGKNLDFNKRLVDKMNLSNVLFLGRRNDIDTILASSYVTMLFTNNLVHAEGVSNSIMESMAASVPVIATTGGGTSEIIINNVDGYIIDSEDYSSAANILIKLLDDSCLRFTIGNKAKLKISKDFSLSGMTDKYIEVYTNLHLH